MIFVVRTDLGMGKGKIAAQCCHAAVMCYQKAMVMDVENLDLWEATGAAKICLKSDGDETSLRTLEKKARELKIVSAIVRDGGHTQVCMDG
jgi:PTH2 family peptidyl-tRNA hydrolase